MKTWTLTQETNEHLINYLQTKPYANVSALLNAAIQEQTELGSKQDKGAVYSDKFINNLSLFLGAQTYKEVFQLVNLINSELAPQVQPLTTSNDSVVTSEAQQTA